MSQNESITPLERVPGSYLDPDHSLRSGTYEGAIATTRYDPLFKERGFKARAIKLKQEKAWQWWGVIDEQMAAGSAIIRLGYASQLFFWCLDRGTGELWCDQEITREPWAASVSSQPLDLEVASFARAGKPTYGIVERLGWQAASMRGELSEQSVHWNLAMSEAVVPMTAICPVKRGRINITVKQAGAAARGEVRVGDKSWQLSSKARGMLDYTHGLLARETSWRWAIGAGTSREGRAISFNVVAGFNQGLENVCWIDGTPHALGRVTVHCDVDAPHKTWRVQGERIDLELEVDGVRQADKDLGVAASRYVQPVGSWRGEVAGLVCDEVWGVAEDHDAKW